MNINYIPRHRVGSRLEKMGDEVLLFRRSASKAIYLSETAVVIWNLCDGHRSVQQIADTLAESYKDAAAEVRADVWETIDRLLREGALRLDPPGQNPENEQAGSPDSESARD